MVISTLTLFGSSGIERTQGKEVSTLTSLTPLIDLIRVVTFYQVIYQVQSSRSLQVQS